MASHNPALSEKIFERETRAAGGNVSPAWGSPADEVPPGLFERGPQAGPSAAAGAAGAIPTWEAPPAAPPVEPVTGGDTMRLGGTISASAILLGFMLVAGWFGWQAVQVETMVDIAGETQVVSTDVPGWIIGAFIVGLVFAIATIIKPKWARITGPLYALAYGAVVGAISKLFEVQFDGIVLQAVGLTVGVFIMMLVLYATGTIKVTDRLRRGILVATGAIALVYLATFVAQLFGSNIPMIHDSGTVGIIFSIVVVGIAAFNLMIDFDFIETGVRMQAPRYMEWYAAFGLLITLVWLYLELLRLLAKLRDS